MEHLYLYNISDMTEKNVNTTATCTLGRYTNSCSKKIKMLNYRKRLVRLQVEYVVTV